MINNKFILSYSPKERKQISKITEQLYLDEIKKFNEIPINNISIKTMYIFEADNNFEAKIFIINNTENNIHLELVPFLILDKEGNCIANETINISDIGEIQPRNIRPYTIHFKKENVKSKVDEGAYIALNFEILSGLLGHKTKIEYVGDNISKYEITLVENYVKNMNPIADNDMNFNIFNRGIDENNNKYCILIISNGLNRNVELEQLKVCFKNQVLGLLQAVKLITNIKVKAKASSVIKVTYEKKDIIRDDFDIENAIPAIEEIKVNVKKD